MVMRWGKNKRNSVAIASSESKQQQQHSAQALSSLQEDSTTGRSSLDSAHTMSHPPVLNHHSSSLSKSDSQTSLHTSSEKTEAITTDLQSLKLQKSSSTATTHRQLNSETYDSTVLKVGYLNKGTNISNYNQTNQDSWRIYRAELKGPTLSLYKLPAEVNVKSFDPSLNSASAQLQQQQQQQLKEQDTRQKRLSTMSSRTSIDSNATAVDSVRQSKTTSTLQTSTSSNSLNAPFDINRRAKLKYISEVYPHPDLQLSSANEIISGSLESVCHTILFHSKGVDKFTYDILSGLPLFGDIKSCLRIFIEYSQSFTTTSSQRLTLRNSNVSGKYAIANDCHYELGQRLGMVCGFFIDEFPGMLLDSPINQLLSKLISGLANYDEQLYKSLKNSFQVKDRVMKNLTLFDTVDYDSQLSKELTNLETFLQIPVDFLAEQINLIHLKFNSLWNPKDDISLLFEIPNTTYHKLNPLVFNPVSNMHYLGRLITTHLFSGANNNEYKRAEALKKWIKLGSQFDKLGDMVSWMAIATTICSIPVLRLTKSWKCLDEKYIKLISLEWAPIVFELDKKSMVGSNSRRVANHVVAPRGLGTIYSKDDVIPYLGDLTIKFMETPTLKQCDNRILIIKRSFIRWNEYLNNIGDVDDSKLNSSRNRKEDPDTARQLYNILTNHVHSDPLSQESVMSLSLAAEPDHTADYNKIGHDSRTPLITGSYLPTLFTEILPSYRLFNQDVLIGASGFSTKANSDSHDQMSDKLLTDQLKVTGNDSIDLHNLTENSKLPRRKTQQQTLLKSVRDIFNIGSAEFHISDDLIFKSLAKDTELRKSRPASVVLENPSNKRLSQISTTGKRFSVTSNEFQKQLAQQLQDSSFNSTTEDEEVEVEDGDDDVFGLLNHPTNSLVKPLNVVLKAGTLDKLIDVLVLTSSVFSNKIQPTDIESYLGKSHVLDNQFLKLKMNNEVFTATFFQTYKSFTSTAQVLNALTLRYIGAKSASVSIVQMNGTSEINEIQWDRIVDPSDTALNWKFVGNVQIGVLEAVLVLVTDHYKDFIHDLQNKASFIELFKAIDYSLSHEWKDVMTTDSVELRSDLKEIYNVLVSCYKKVRKIFIKNSYSPVGCTIHSSSSAASTPVGADLSLFVSDPSLDLNELQLPADFRSAELFVDQLDKFLNEVFLSISINDWNYVFQLLEIQSFKSLTSLFKFKAGTAKNEDHMEILNVFKWIGSLYSANSDDKILAKFPAQVQLLFRLHDNLEKYFKLQICDVSISREQRTTRMISILQVLTISRLRMTSVNIFDPTSTTAISPHVPSFIETAISQAIVSPESRSFGNSWVYASSTLRKETVQSFDQLIDLLPDFEVDDLTPELNDQGLTPCIGWFVERLLEISNFVPNMSIENSKLINFDKRRFAYNCISHIVDMNDNNSACSLEESQQFQILYKLADVKVASLESIEKCSTLEAAEYSTPKVKIFSKLINAEQCKLQRDSAKREVLQNQEIDIKRNQLLSQSRLRHHQSSTSLSSNSTDVSSRKSKGLSTVSNSKPSVGKKLGGFFKSVRPFSINVTSGWSSGQTNDKVVHPDDLPDLNTLEFPTGKHNKPSYQVQVFSTRTLFIHTNIEGFFKIVADNNTTTGTTSGQSSDEEFVFQATSNSDAQSWISAFNQSKRYSYLSKDSKTNNSKVFGIPIQDICERESSYIPKIVDMLLQEIELRGMDEVGLYRIPGSVASINSLKQAFDDGGEFNLEDDRWFEVNTLGGCFKSYLRELPETPLTKELLPRFVELQNHFMAQGTNHTTNMEYVDYLKTLVAMLPNVNYNLLKRLFQHLYRVDQHSENNRMDSVNLAIVFAMSFVNNDNLGMGMGADLGALQNILQCLIKNQEMVFCEEYKEVMGQHETEE